MLAKFITFWKRNFPLKLSREVYNNNVIIIALFILELKAFSNNLQQFIKYKNDINDILQRCLKKN